VKALFIVNPRSGAGRRDVRQTIERHCKDTFEIVECPPKEELDPVIERAKRESFDVIYAVGGDGTVHEVAKRLVGSRVALGIIPTGSGNGLARHLGFPIDVRQALCTTPRAATVDTAAINGIPFVGTMGVGFDAWVADAFASSGVRGLRSYIRVGLDGFLKYKPETYQIEVDGDKLERRALLIAIANASQYGNNARIAPVASLQDGVLDLVIVERASLGGAVRLFAGSLHRAKGITMRRGRHIVIRRPAPGPAHLDGEPVSLPETLTIDIVPRSLRVLVPESARAI
jgi:YegS/Rv2252/BmrU family lipid kinase